MRAAVTLVLALLLPRGILAQTVEDLRRSVRDSVGRARMTTFLSGMIDLGENRDLSSGHITIEGEPDLDLTTYALPYRHEFGLGSKSVELQVEAGAGYLEARSALADLWSGTLAGGETKVRTRWRGVSAYVGAGPRFALGSGFHLTPLVNGSISYLENRTYYEGPGAAFTRSILDGILFNWHATSGTLGATLRGEHECKLSERYALASVLRYDVRRYDGIDSSDQAQDLSDTLQRLVARTELTGPTPWTLQGRSVEWATFFAYSRFLDLPRSTLGFLDYFEVGARLMLPLPKSPLPFESARLSGSVLIGEDILGFSFGFSVRF